MKRTTGIRSYLMMAAALLLVAACATTNDTAEVTQADLIETAEAEPSTHDPIGLPPRVVSPIGAEHPSSVAGGAGNMYGSGTNTNLNAPPPTPAVVTVTETQIIEEPMVSAVVEPPPPPVVVETVTTTEIIEEPVQVETVTTRTVTRKD